MQARKIDVVVTSCVTCPYSHYEAEIGEAFCVCDKGNEFPLENLLTVRIHPDCPLPVVEKEASPGFDPNLTAGCSCCGEEEDTTPYNQFNAQMATLNGIPDEWLDKLTISEAEKQRLQEEEDRMIEMMLAETGIDFDILDQPEK